MSDLFEPTKDAFKPSGFFDKELADKPETEEPVKEEQEGAEKIVEEAVAE